MARKVEEHLVDDLDGSTGAEPVEFQVSGRKYSIDLTATNAARLDKARAALEKAQAAMAEFTGVARTQRAPRRDTSAIREWARGQGLDVSDQGRIPADVMAKWEAREEQ